MGNEQKELKGEHHPVQTTVPVLKAQPGMYWASGGWLLV